MDRATAANRWIYGGAYAALSLLFILFSVSYTHLTLPTKRIV